MLLPLLLLGWTLAASPAPAERRYTPCPDASPEWTEARKRFETLEVTMAALPDNGNTGEVLAALKEVLGSRCFEMSREERRVPEAGVHALALEAWWRDGGRAWVASYLELGRPGVRRVVLPPDLRPVLTRDTVPSGHRLAPWLCAAGDAVCTSGTEAWYARADAAFLPENQPRPQGEPLEEPDAESTLEADCLAQARSQPKRWRYTAWRSCLGNTVLRERALPLTRLRAPEGGWLVVRGRRGHYDFCDEVRAYHLATGAAYVVQSCSDLVLIKGGHVDASRTDAARQTRILAGTLAPEKLKALTWMMLLAPEAKGRLQPWARVLVVPKDFSMEWREKYEPGDVDLRVLGVGSWGHTGRTRLHWTWFPPTKAEPLSGDFSWPDDSDPEDNHVDVLLQEAEATFREGCPPLPPPLDLLDFTQAPGVNHRDAPEGVDKTQDSLLEALRDWHSPSHCQPSLND